VEFGPWQTVWERHFRCSQDGTYQLSGATNIAAALSLRHHARTATTPIKLVLNS